MLGTFIFQMVMTKFSDPKIEEVPTKTMASIHKVWAALAVIKLKGGYAVQPDCEPPNKKLASTSNPAGGFNQKAIAFSLGKAISLAPIINGTR
ncbi:hypothetical protein NUACC21_37710 [Scytonema sp. NUACC21]